MTRTSAKKVARSSLWLTSSFVVAKLSQLIAQIFLARLLSPQEFGIWGMVMIVTTLSALFQEKAIASVLVQRGLDDKKLVNAVYSLATNISIGMFFLQVLAGFPLSQLFGVPQLWSLTALTAFVFLIGAGAGSHGAVLARQMKFKELAICDTAAGFARFAGAVICAAFGGGVWSFAAGEIAMACSHALLKRWFSGYRFTYHLIPDRSALHEVRGYISSLVGINLAVYANTNSDNFLIGKLLGAEFLGYYSLAYQLAMLPTFAVTQLNRVSFSVLSQQDDKDKRSHVCRTIELYALLYAPVYGVAFVVASWFFPTVYGARWAAAVPLFQIVLIFAYARGFMAILGTALNALNKPHINAAINWALVPLSIPAFFLGAQLGGVTGVAIAVALVMGVGATVWFWLATCRAAGWSVAALSKPVFLPTVTIGIAVAAALATPLPAYLQPYLQPPLVVLLYGIILSVLSGGRIPRMLIALCKRSLNIGPKGANVA